MTQNGIIWFKLCRFSGLIYNTIYFHLQKVQILKKRGEDHLYPPPPKLPTDTDCYTMEKKTQNNAVAKGVKVNLH